jgi:uncharacterized membrane-anchored protein
MSSSKAKPSGRDHPLRASLSHQMHARKLPPLKAPATLRQVVMLVDEAEAAASVAHVRTLLPKGATLDDEARFHSCRLGGIGFAWERHNEFVTCTFIAETAGDALFDATPFARFAAWLAAAPGQVVRASLISLLGRMRPWPSEAELAETFALDDLVISDVVDGRARIWTDFRLHGDSGRLLVVDRGLSGNETNQLVQRLQELGNYRKMALLGLPVAQRLLPQVTACERSMAALARELTDGGSSDEALLARLSELSADVARMIAETRYRMSATQAYGELALDRMRRLSVGQVPGFPSLPDFTERRLLPAMRTCDAFSRRLDDMSQRLSWISDLLRTRVDTELARQNRDLLASMDRRTRLQLRLQQAVEGLSVVAISYYLVGLVGHAAALLHYVGVDLDREVVTAFAVPLALLAAWLGLRALHKRLND